MNKHRGESSYFLGITLLFFLCLAGLDIQAQINLSLLSNLPYQERVMDIWAYENQQGETFALVGVKSGLSIVDVSNTSSPKEVVFLAGAISNWRDIKTWGSFAYVSDEKSAGLMIVDLSNLPHSASFQHWTGGSIPFQSAHNLFIDEKGKLFVMGSDFDKGGIIIYDLQSNPQQPNLVGIYNDAYVHDCFARGDTIYAAQNISGHISILDASDPSLIKKLASFATPGRASHNCWVDKKGEYLYASDEEAGATISVFDIRDLNNIAIVENYQSSPDSNVIPHNVFVYNDHLVISYYRDGVKLVDISDPTNAVEAGNFDTSPELSGKGFNGCWGVYPFLPNNIILATDIENGLFVFKANYSKAAKVHGNISKRVSGRTLSAAKVTLFGQSTHTYTNYFGNYQFGVSTSGNYKLQVEHAECSVMHEQYVELISGQDVLIDIKLDCYASAYNENIENVEIRYNGLNVGILNNVQTISSYKIYNMTGQLVSANNRPTSHRVVIKKSLSPGLYAMEFSIDNRLEHLILYLP